ncbi:hypothetical protein SBA6_1000018 [Candidatus Sulfopaludibacter sp. SbA6]|nr:hypothetical protein SBA6_1000018 [Candidatus Sulfopaludibacter sp. SbA6]
MEAIWRISGFTQSPTTGRADSSFGSIFQSKNDPEMTDRFQYRMILKKVHLFRVVSFL